jgi:NACHT domain
VPIVGVSGSGKSTLLARIWSALAAGPVAREGLVFVRFVGSTSASRDLEDLLSGLCADIDRADARDETLPTGVDAWRRRCANGIRLSICRGNWLAWFYELLDGICQRRRRSQQAVFEWASLNTEALL